MLTLDRLTEQWFDDHQRRVRLRSNVGEHGPLEKLDPVTMNANIDAIVQGERLKSAARSKE